MSNSEAQRVTPPVMHHGEGPFWDAVSNRLLCTDVLAGALIAIDNSGYSSRHKVPSKVTTVVRRRTSGGFVISTERGLVAANEDLSLFEEIAVISTDPDVRTNDGGCDPLGGFVIGTMAYSERANSGAVYRVDRDHQVTEVLSPVSISNGVQWSADGARVFYIDTPTRGIDVFDVDPETGAWSDRRRHIDVDASRGYPDGMAIDEEDGLWVALWGGGAVDHYDARGRLVETVRVPGISHVSSCAFGGTGRDMLYITTSQQGLADDEESAGAVFAIQMSARGAVPAEFAG